MKLVEAKAILITKMDQVSKINTFLRKKDGFEVTGPEGYVAIDRMKGNAMKIVDRLSFSHANFSPDIIKGFEAKARKP
jgi:hypothetical protein